MSMVGRVRVDLSELGELAARAAQLPTPAARFDALRAVFGECGERANAYYCPENAARHLVRAVVHDFRTSRMQVQLDSVMN